MNTGAQQWTVVALEERNVWSGEKWKRESYFVINVLVLFDV